MFTELWCRHPDCQGKMLGRLDDEEQRNVHMEELHHKKRGPIQDPTRLVKEIRKLKKKLHNKKWSRSSEERRRKILGPLAEKTYTLLYTTPKRGKVKIMRKELLKEIYDLQDDLEWIRQHPAAAEPEPDPAAAEPEPATRRIWLDLVVSPNHPYTGNVGAGFCLGEHGQPVKLDDGDEEGRQCFNRLLECMEESCDQLETLETHVKKFLDAKKLRSFAFVHKTAVQRGKWDELDEGVTETIADHLRAFKSGKKSKKKPKKKKPKKKKPKRTRRR